MRHSSRGLRIAVLACAAALQTGPSHAADPPKGRYTMLPTEGGFVRLDTETGVTSICARRGDDWACEAMPDGQQALRDQIAKLEAENKRLQDEMRLMEETIGIAPRPGEPGAAGPMSPDAGPPAPKPTIPTEKDVDRMFDYIEGMVRKFKERIERMEKDPGGPDAPGPDGQGTDPGGPDKSDGGPQPTTPL